MSGKKSSNLVLTVMVLTAVIVTPTVLLGVYLGYYVGAASGVSGSIMAIVFSTAGFLAAVAVLSKLIVRMVAREARNRAS